MDKPICQGGYLALLVQGRPVKKQSNKRADYIRPYGINDPVREDTIFPQNTITLHISSIL